MQLFCNFRPSIDQVSKKL